MNDNDEPGFKVTLKDVYDEVKALRGDWDARIRKIEVQIGAQWVVIGIVIVALGAAAAKIFTS